ncbi:hypothetical protein AB4620_23330, partial [Vibrio cyclitrophicus]
LSICDHSFHQIQFEPCRSLHPKPCVPMKVALTCWINNITDLLDYSLSVVQITGEYQPIFMKFFSPPFIAI